MPIVFASMGDYDNTAKNVQGSKLYYEAAKKASAYPAGAYGDWDLFNAIGPTPLSVQAAAKAWSWDWAKNKWKGPHPTAHILQLPSRVVARPNVDNNPATVNWYGTSVDPLDILKPTKAWYPYVPALTLTAPHKVIRLTSPLTRSVYVRALAECLVAYGWYSRVQDTYGPNMENAWRQTQKRFGIPVTGVYDELGRVKLQQYINTHPVPR
jgi:hypothetical protein